MNYVKTIFLFALCVLVASIARGQLTCNGSLTCSVSTPAYTITNNGTGTGLKVVSAGAKGIDLQTSSGTGTALSISPGYQGIEVLGSTFGRPIHAVSGSGNYAGVESEGLYYHGLEGTSGGNTTGSYHGVVGKNIAASGTGGYGVYGESRRNTGVYGKALLSGQYGVYASGNLGASGTKTFVEPHPYDASKQIHYAALEGPEAGTYFRGTGKTVRGTARIVVPEDFRIVTAEEGLTVHITPVGQIAVVACIKKNLNEILVQSTRDVEFDYIVHGVRRAFADFQPVVDNTDFVPQSADDVALVAGLPAESVLRLKMNGTLTQDGAVDVGTAERLGWTKRDTWREPKTNDR